MIQSFDLNSFSPNEVKELKTSGQDVLYVFINQAKDRVLYSSCLSELLDTQKSLQVSSSGLSFLLQSGLVPPPETVFEGLYSLFLGWSMQLQVLNGKIEITSHYQFQFPHYAKVAKPIVPDFNEMISLIGSETKNALGEFKHAYFFHSAGKDSNTVALGLAQAGLQNKITFVTHQSKGKYDESAITKEIVQKLNFQQIILKEKESFELADQENIKSYFSELPLPSTDNVTLSLASYLPLMPELKNSIVISGDGNDQYMGIPASGRDSLLFRLGDVLSPLRYLFQGVKSERLINLLMKTRVEWCQLEGFSFGDTKKILSSAVNVFPFWRKLSVNHQCSDELDFKTEYFTRYKIDAVHVMKMRLASEVWKSRLITPLALTEVISYFYALPEKFLFNRQKRKNKIILRDLLKEKLALDSDAIGKKGYNFDTFAFVSKNSEWVVEEITHCRYWNKIEVENILTRLQQNSGGQGIKERFAARLIFRLFVVSLWLNKSKYVKGHD